MAIRPLHILHVFPTFSVGGAQMRTCAIINGLGPAFSHTVMATDGNLAAEQRVNPDARFTSLPAPPGKGGIFYSFAFAKTLRAQQPDLLITYNWGAIDAVIGAQMAGVCPVLHTEDGFNPDEAISLKRRRVWLRRLFLNRTYGLVVPSRTLSNIALRQYRLAAKKVHWIPNGVDVDTLQPARNPELRRRWGIPEGSLAFGYVGRLGAEKNLGLLLGAFAAAAPADARLVIVGDGPCRRELEALARALAIGARVVFAGATDSAPVFAAFDIFCMSSNTEQMSMALLEAMACGLPVLCTDVGDSSEILANPGRPAVVPPGDLAAYSGAIRALSGDARLRTRLAQANRDRCVRHYSVRRMISAYGNIYCAAARRLDICLPCPGSETVRA
jgi:L-malate glycosyltransferase